MKRQAVHNPQLGITYTGDIAPWNKVSGGKEKGARGGV